MNLNYLVGSEKTKGDSKWRAALADVLEEKVAPLIGRKTIQIVLIREAQDYTILRTEETREINTVWTAKSSEDSTPIERAAFLATKQKAAESRELESMLRSWASGRPECYLKSQLCMKCPRCILFGATDVSKGTDKGANIKHRIAYGTAFSLEAIDPGLREVHTFNGVSGATQLTGQTLGERESIRPGSPFISVVTLRSVTEIELILTVKVLLACTRYGAETRVGGIVRNHIVGISTGYEEIASPLELTLRLADTKADTAAVPRGRVTEILSDFKRRSSMPDRVHVFEEAELQALLSDIQAVEINDVFVNAAFKAAEDFQKHQATYLKKEKPGKGGK